MHFVNRKVIITAALAAALPACRSTGGRPPSPVCGSTNLGSDPTGGDEGLTLQCDQWGCGSNTAQVQGTSIGALHLGGEGNQNGFTITPTLNKDGKTYQLDIRNGEIIGHHSVASSAPLRGKDLVGSWFVLNNRNLELSVRVAINNVALVPLWTVRSSSGQQPARPEDHEYAFAYELKFPDFSREDAAFMCRPVSWGWSWVEYPPVVETVPRGSGKCPVAQPVNGYKVLSWTEQGRYAVLVKGETYNASDVTVDLSGTDGEPWFNIACAGTALSKMKLMGYDPEQTSPAAHSTTPGQRQAALKMITARYCDLGDTSSDAVVHFTTEGQPLVWQNAGQWFRPDFVGIDPSQVGEVEAVWNESGAVCLNTPRWQEKWTRAGVIAACGHDLPECGDSHLSPAPASASLGHVPKAAELVSRALAPHH